MPRVSIIMLSWNSQDFISYSIQSILNQSFNDWELLLYDDASNDETIDIINSYVKSDNRIKLVGFNLKREGHSGIGRMRNLCIKHSKSEFIAVTDSDDIRYPRNLEICLERFDEYPIYSVLSTDYDEIGPNNDILIPSTCLLGRKKLTYAKLDDIVDITEIMKSRGGGQECPIAPSATMVKRVVIYEAGLYSESWKYHTDSNLYRRILSLGKTHFGIIPIVLASYRIHDNQRTKMRKIDEWREPLKL